MFPWGRNGRLIGRLALAARGGSHHACKESLVDVVVSLSNGVVLGHLLGRWPKARSRSGAIGVLALQGLDGRGSTCRRPTSSASWPVGGGRVRGVVLTIARGAGVGLSSRSCSCRAVAKL